MTLTSVPSLVSYLRLIKLIIIRKSKWAPHTQQSTNLQKLLSARQESKTSRLAPIAQISPLLRLNFTNGQKNVSLQRYQIPKVRERRKLNTASIWQRTCRMDSWQMMKHKSSPMWILQSKRMAQSIYVWWAFSIQAKKTSKCAYSNLQANSD